MAKKRVDKPHFKFINSLPCCKCGQPPLSDCAHIRKGADGGMGLKSSPWFTVPLCHRCHMEQHRIGEVSFYNGRLDEAINLARQLYNNTGDFDACISLILEFRRK